MCSMRKDTIFSAILLITITVALAATVTAVKAETTYDVYIMDPPTSGVQGVSSNGYWVGEIPVRISSGTTPPFQTVSYWIQKV